jgi:vacuolar-type H+-ATPase subunit H
MMEPNPREPDDTASLPDARVARAMDRILQAERAAQSTIAECERTCADILEHARQQGRAILERAQARIVALHTRAAKGLELRVAELTEERRKSAAVALVQLSDSNRRSAALQRLADRLTTTEVAGSHDGH